MFYSFSFLPDLEQEWPLTERYPGQPDILRYLDEVADRLDLRKDFTFGAEVTALEFDEAASRWTLRTAQGHQVSARYVVTAVGCLSTANQPRFPGADTFQGLSLHTGNWPREPVDFAGQRVAVIGTGASGIQAIPVIAEQAAHLTVFQRTAQFTIPAENGPLDEQFVALWKQNYPEWRRRARHSPAGFAYNPSITSAFEVSAAERHATFEAAWGAGGFTFLSGTFRDLALNEEANETAADFVRSKIDEIVDYDLESTSYLDPANQLIVSRDAMEWFWNHYAPDPEGRLHPDASPLRSASFAGLPPAVILTAEHDPLRDEGELYATRLVKAGVPVRHRRFGGQMHGFFTMVDALPGAAAGLDYVAAAIDEQLSQGDRKSAPI